MAEKTKVEELREFMNELTDYDKMDRLKKLFNEAVPDDTVILFTNDDYEVNVPDPFDTAIWNDHIDHYEIIQAVAFRKEENSVYCVQAYDDRDDEVFDCYYYMDFSWDNLNLFNRLLRYFECGKYIQDGEDPNWKTLDEAEEEECEEDE